MVSCPLFIALFCVTTATITSHINAVSDLLASSLPSRTTSISYQDGASPEHSLYRSLRTSRSINNWFVNFLVGPFADFKSRMNKFRCLNLRGTNCVCDESGLRRAILDGRTIDICHDTTIQLSDQINITGQSFVLYCNYVCPRGESPCDNNSDIVDQLKSCTIRGDGNNRLFVGAPIGALFADINFMNGAAGSGGAILLSGGRTIFRGCTFNNNTATGTGGSISAVGPKTVVEIRDGLFSNNSADNGGAIFVSSGATMTLSGIWEGNTAISFGGAALVSNATLQIYDGIFRNNIALGNTDGDFDEARMVNSPTLETNEGIFTNNDVLGFGRNIYIADDSDPSNFTGTNVTCMPSKNARIIFCNGEGVTEYAAGANNTQDYLNTNCLTTAVIVNTSVCS